MPDTDSVPLVPTRRDTIRYGSAVVGGGLLAGCTGSADTTENSTAETEADTDTYSVTMNPTGTMEFTEPPEEVAIYITGYADIMASLGQFDRVVAMNGPEEHFPSEYYDRLPGVDISVDGVTDFFPEGSNSADKEIFYEVDPDLSLIDPAVAKQYLGLDDSDIEELSENVAPFFGSLMRRPQFSDEHPYYSLYEGTERVAQIFQQQARFEALETVHDELRAEIRGRLPTPDERPTFGYLNVNWWGNFDTATVMRANAPGYQNKVFRDLEFDEANNAFVELIPEGEWSAKTDFEGLLEADPEILIWRNGYNFITGIDFDGNQLNWADGIVGRLESDTIAGELQAVKNDRIYPGTATGSGPVTNLFNMEAVAKQLYPEEFGPYDPAQFPNEQSGEKLFDRQRVADIINGDF